MLSKCWTRGFGNNPAGIGKTTWKDINPKSITPNEVGSQSPPPSSLSHEPYE